MGSQSTCLLGCKLFATLVLLGKLQWTMPPRAGPSMKVRFVPSVELNLIRAADPCSTRGADDSDFLLEELLGNEISHLERGCDEGGSDGFFVFSDLFWGALGDDLASVGAGFGAEVDDVVSFGGEIHMVLDDDDGVAFID